MARNVPDFKKTQEISLDIAAQIASMSSLSTIRLALKVNIPMNPEDPNLRGAPTILKDGKIFVDTASLLRQIERAIRTRNYKDVPDVLNLQQAVKNVLEKNPTITTSIRPKDTLPEISAEQVRAALAIDNEKTPPTGIPIPRRNPTLAQTVKFKPVKPENP